MCHLNATSKTQKSKLVKLDLSNNFLQHLSKAYFKNMPDLQILRLHGNKINYLTQEPGPLHRYRVEVQLFQAILGDKIL